MHPKMLQARTGKYDISISDAFRKEFASIMFSPEFAMVSISERGFPPTIFLHVPKLQQNLKQSGRKAWSYQKCPHGMQRQAPDLVQGTAQL